MMMTVFSGDDLSYAYHQRKSTADVRVIRFSYISLLTLIIQEECSLQPLLFIASHFIMSYKNMLSFLHSCMTCFLHAHDDG